MIKVVSSLPKPSLTANCSETPICSFFTAANSFLFKSFQYWSVTEFPGEDTDDVKERLLSLNTEMLTCEELATEEESESSLPVLDFFTLAPESFEKNELEIPNSSSESLDTSSKISSFSSTNWPSFDAYRYLPLDTCLILYFRFHIRAPPLVGSTISTSHKLSVKLEILSVFVDSFPSSDDFLLDFVMI